MAVCNMTLEDQDVSHVDLGIGITFQHLGLLIAAVFGLISIILSGWLIAQHAFHYSRPLEQVHIIRILFMIPIYSTVSFLSYLFYKESIYYQVLRDCYEAFAISSFFTLLTNYLAPTLHDQKDHFRAVTPKNWIWPVPYFQKCSGGENKGWLRKPASGLTWFNVIYLGIFQYCFIRVVCTIISVITEAAGVYCILSDSPAFAKIWVEVFESISVSIAMYTLIQFYWQTRKDLAEHKPFLKILSIKLVIFFSFWQSFVISALSSTHGPVHPTAKLAYPDIAVGIPSVLLCIEMAFFSVLHLFAYPVKPYRIPHDAKLQATPGQPTTYLGGAFGYKAYMDAFNPWDILKATARGFRWLFVGRRTRRLDPSYNTASGAWSGEGAFEVDATPGLAVTTEPTKLQTFNQGWSRVPTAGEQTAYPGPHLARPDLSKDPSAAEEDDTWAMQADPAEDYYGTAEPLAHRASYEIGAEDRAGLLRHPQAPGGAGPIRPVRNESEEGYDKETSIEEQYEGYGRYSWGNRSGQGQGSGPGPGQGKSSGR